MPTGAGISQTPPKNSMAPPAAVAVTCHSPTMSVQSAASALCYAAPEDACCAIARLCRIKGTCQAAGSMLTQILHVQDSGDCKAGLDLHASLEEERLAVLEFLYAAVDNVPPPLNYPCGGRAAATPQLPPFPRPSTP